MTTTDTTDTTDTAIRPVAGQIWICPEGTLVRIERVSDSTFRYDLSLAPASRDRITEASWTLQGCAGTIHRTRITLDHANVLDPVRLLAASQQEARELGYDFANNTGRLPGGEDAPVRPPAKPILRRTPLKGTQLSLGDELVIAGQKYRLEVAGGTLALTLIPYPTPEAGQTWLLGDTELLVLENGQAADLKSGAVIALDPSEIGALLTIKGGY